MRFNPLMLAPIGSLLGVIMIVVGCGESREPTPIEVEQKCQQEELRKYSDALIAIAEIKNACGLIRKPMRFTVCRNVPFLGVLTETASCDDIRHAREVTEDFVLYAAPEFVEACWDDDLCRQWRYSYKGGGGAPTWWDLKPIAKEVTR